MGDLQDHILDAIRSESRSLADVERAADAAGVPHGRKATTSQRAAILARMYGWGIETPDSGMPTAPANGGGAARSGVSTPPAGAETPAAATVPDSGVVPPASESAPASSELLDAVLEVTGGELVPPKPKTPEFEAMTPKERVTARAYWQAHPEPEPPSLAEQLGAPLA